MKEMFGILNGSLLQMTDNEYILMLCFTLFIDERNILLVLLLLVMLLNHFLYEEIMMKHNIYERV